LSKNETPLLSENANVKEHEEKKQSGLLSWKTYFDYFRVGSGILGAFLNFFIFIVSHALLVGSDYWISRW
jgi:hypothetical protein